MNLQMYPFYKFWVLLLAASIGFEWWVGGSQLELAGLSVTPHVQSTAMRYRRAPDPELGARVELFLRNDKQAALTIGPDFDVLFDGQIPEQWIDSNDWTWHDTPSARTNETIFLPPGALTVWRFNSRNAKFGTGTEHQLTLPPDTSDHIEFSLQEPKVWLSSVTFLGDGDSVQPDRMIVHVANESGQSITPRASRLWLPIRNADYRVLHPQTWKKNLSRFPVDESIPSGEKGGFTLELGALPLTYCAVEVELSTEEGQEISLWAHMRIKREEFVIGGGWIADQLGDRNTLQTVPFLKAMRRMHINCGMHQDVAGYSDTSLFDKYPLQYMNRLEPFQHYDSDKMLPRIHAVEFQGEPQYGGGRPVPPQEVFTKFLPYGPTRLPTSVTHSEERIWRYYAGLSDYPHYDAYRVCAPSADAWRLYDRWGDVRLSWGAPMETIGDMTRSLRELNRPRPIAYWSQGAHAGWGRYGGRQRTSPTPDELRAQAYHGLSHRITSLYWFNLSLKSLLKFRDLIVPITRVNREIRLMEDLLLEGDAFEHRRVMENGQPSWDLSSITGPNGALLFAHNLAYFPDLEQKVFKFEPRDGDFVFNLPTYLVKPAEVFKLNADGPSDVVFTVEGNQIKIQDRLSVTGLYVIAAQTGLRSEMQAHHSKLLEYEESFGFDPANNDSHFEMLRQLVP